MNLKVIRNILLVFFCGTFLSVYSQTIPYYHYTTKDGLADGLVHYVYQDINGYIWLGTWRGVSRFDGNTFTNYTEGLINSNIGSIAEGTDSTLYFSNISKGLNCYKNGKISNYEITPENPKIETRITAKNDTIYIIHHRKNVSYIYKNVMHTYDSLFFIQNGIRPGITEIYPYKHPGSSNTVLLVGTEDGLFEIDTRQNTIKNFLINGGFPAYSISEDKDNNIWIGSSGKIYKVRDNNAELMLTLDEKNDPAVYRMLVDSRGYVWFHPLSNGLYVMKNGRVIDVGTKLSLGSTQIRHLYEDREGNVWVATAGKGVYCFYNFFISNYTEDDGLITNNILKLLVSDKGTKFIGTLGGLNLLEKNKIEKVITGNEQYTNELIRQIKKGINDNYIISGGFTSSGFSGTYFNNKLIFFKTNNSFQLDSATYITNMLSNNSNILTYNNLVDGNLIKYDEKRIFKDITANISIFDIERTNDGALLVGTNKGLCKIKGNEETYYKTDSVLSSGIRSIKVTPSGTFLIAGVKGISIISSNPEKITSLEKTNNFDFSRSTSIDIDNENNIWIGNPKGLYRISLDSLINGKYNEVLCFNDKTALPSFDVKTISYDKVNNELWIGTPDGLTKMELSDLNKYLKPAPRVLIENVILSDTSITNFGNLVFKPTQNNIRVHYTSFNYSSPKTIKYEYKIDGDETWTGTPYSDIDLYPLPPGKYNLLIRAVNINQAKGEITSLKFQILAPFWKTIWFYSLLALLFLALIFYIVQKRIKQIKAKADEKIKTENSISSLKHQALSASMNPHFIFNTLNSIQAYMNTHSKEDANEYIVKFSRLIRLNLDLAGQTFIPLETEIQRLELYLKYEKIRFEDMLNYEIKIDENIDRKSLMIPNMILQPFVENSIWHGILHKEEPGNILINVSKENLLISQNNVPAVTIDIIDDGVGLDAVKDKKPGHTSKGISLIKERLKLLAGDKTDYEYVTIRNRGDEKSGVVVSIRLFPEQYLVSQ